MARPFKGVVNIDVTESVPDWEPYTQPILPAGTPNVLYIVLDDVGFSAMEPFGGLIETPNINRIADKGLLYTNFHTTALCSPTRSCLMTGRNHTTNGMASITEAASGFPSSCGHIPFECGTLAEVLGEKGWNTYAVGKWHLTPEDEMNMASVKSQWPVGRGFERFYGFLGAETNQWYPDLIYDNHPVAPPALPEDGYHLSTDLADKALEFIRDAKAVAPQKPFFLYFCPGAAHAPHQVPKEWADRYAGKFDMGYEAYRELVFDRQKRLGILPDGAELSPINPYAEETSVDGKRWPEADTVRPWDSLSDDEQTLFRRMAEVYAGFLSHADNEIGRLLDHLEETGELENTLIVLVSDNGASGEGGPNGSVNENKYFNGIPDDIEENLRHLDDLGGPLTYNHYPTGWACAFNTPFKLWKRYGNWEGGTADHDLAAEHPEQLQELIGLWWEEAGRYQALPLENRDALEILTTNRPQLSPPRSRYVYYPGCAEVPEAAAPNLRNRSFTIAVEATINTEEAEGVLFAQGSRFGGHALYIKDGRLKYVNSFVGSVEQAVESTEPVPTGRVVLSASFEREGDGMPAEGTLTLHIREEAVGAGQIKTQPGKFTLAGEGLNVGRDSGAPVTDDYPGNSPWPFVGGTIKRAAVDVSGEPFVDLANEARMAYARD